VPHVEGTVPYPWPYDESLDPGAMALVVAGAQVGWMARCPDAGIVTGVIESIRPLFGTVVLVRHNGVGGADARAAMAATPTPSPSPFPPTLGSTGWALALDPHLGDIVVDAAGIDGFFASSLDAVLRSRGVRHLVLAGFGAEAAVDSTLRSANDRGYECLVLSDAVAPFGADTGRRALHSVTMSGGIFGAVGTATALRHALVPLVPEVSV
jgi:nicotinamidase-related amidase